MSLHPEANGEIPELTRNVARASFPKPTPPMVLRDELGTLFSDPDFAGLYGTRGQPALSPWRLMVVTMLQFLENLTDRQAANAVRARIDCLGQYSADDDACPLEICLRPGIDQYRIRCLGAQ